MESSKDYHRRPFYKLCAPLFFTTCIPPSIPARQSRFRYTLGAGWPFGIFGVGADHNRYSGNVLLHSNTYQANLQSRQSPFWFRLGTLFAICTSGQHNYWFFYIATLAASDLYRCICPPKTIQLPARVDIAHTHLFWILAGTFFVGMRASAGR